MCYVDVCFPQCHSDVAQEDENKMQGNFHSIPVNSREDIVMRSNQRFFFYYPDLGAGRVT